MPASGVRRSWLTAASSAVRMRLPSASARARSASSWSRRRSSTTAAWAAKAASTRRSSAGRTRPVSASAIWSPTGMSTSASSGRSTGCPCPTRPAQVHGVDIARPLQQGRRLHAEGLPDAFEQVLQAGLAAQHVAREEGQDLGLRPQPGRLMGAAGREVDHGGHRHTDGHEDHDGDDVLRVGDRPPVQRRCVEVVQQQRSHRRRGQRGKQPAEQGRRDCQRQEQQHVVGEAEVDGVEQRRQGRRGRRRRRSSPTPAGSARGARPGPPAVRGPWRPRRG
ncbi:hypothetical protein SPURM210S_07993 [Streptomyces purpurascens]